VRARSSSKTSTNAPFVRQHSSERTGSVGRSLSSAELALSSTPPPSPPSAETEFIESRRISGRLAALSSKRSYTAMQGTSSGARRSKICKVLGQNHLENDYTSRSGAGEGTGETSISSKPSTEELGTGVASHDSPHASENLETSTNAYHPNANESLWHADVQRKDNEELFSEDDIPIMTHDDGLAILDGYFPKSPVTKSSTSHALVLDTLRPSVDGTIRRTASEPPAQPSQPFDEVLTAPFLAAETTAVADSYQTEPHPANRDQLTTAIHARPVRRTALDESGFRLEDVMKALAETTDTSRIPDLIVPGVSKYLLEDLSIDYSKIVTSLATNCAKSTRNLSKPALFAEKERLGEYQRITMERIADERQQMNVTLPARLASEVNHQQYADRLRKETQQAIVRLDLNEVAEKELQDTLSEPSELTGEFRDESDFEKVIKQLEKDKANSTKTQQRRLWKETFYWPMIQQRAKMVGQLPKPSGPKTDITPQEKAVAKRLILALGYGTSRDNVFKWTSYWKLLSDLRNNGLSTLLLYRTSEFKTCFFRNAKKHETLLAWNQVLDFPLQQLRRRVIAQEGGDFSGKCDIENSGIFDRLRTARPGAWCDELTISDESNPEHENLSIIYTVMATSGRTNQYVLYHGIKGEKDCNKSVFVTLVPYDGKSGKRVIGNKPASTKLLSVSTLAAAAPGDFLGLFPGKIREADRRPSSGIGTPFPGLWLDYSETPGKLNHMRVAKAGEMTNVCLAWEGVNEVKGEKSFC
jgi:hypothetical protein